MKFGQILRELRLEKDMTQKQLADVFNVHQTTVKDWELRGCEPSYEILSRLANFFGVTADYLLGREK
ncbi:MAG: helix-turn-helix domain-containing protein [Firmicutes bacterium]|nr:helix-turn-helix domain-containing protein [Bacillota bacterium]